VARDLEPTFIDLFSGAGGLSLGLETAGFRSLLAVDNWKDATATYEKNFRGHRLICDDIGKIDRRVLNGNLEARPDWVVGGPPCQGFSTLGKRQRADPRNKLFREFVRIVDLLRPQGFVLENVLGLKDMAFERTISRVFADLDGGYEVTFLILTSADYGVPQLRRRIMFVGHKELGTFLGPRKTHLTEGYVSVWDAIGDLPALGPGEEAKAYDKPAITAYQRRMRRGSHELQGHAVSNHPPALVKAISFVPDGGNRRSIPDTYQPSSGHHNTYSRLNSREPAVAVTQNMGKPSGHRAIHPFQHRGLTAREGARLQSFPDRFHFAGGVTSQRLQVANAVPPLLAEAVGGALRDETRWTREPRTLFDLRKVS
jgi:DNA (cytosine-5)-methyltransferase 1